MGYSSFHHSTTENYLFSVYLDVSTFPGWSTAQESWTAPALAVQGPEFKFQYHQQEKKRRDTCIFLLSELSVFLLRVNK
jgi:hypothetical protein